MKENLFEKIKKINKYGYEFWYARELAKILNYTDYGNFENVIDKAKKSCENSGQNIKNHFGDATEMVNIGSMSERKFSSYKLSRYACYLIAQNGDPRKVEIAKAQTYFAIKTRQKEIEDNLIEDNKRVFLRGEMKEHNKNLASVAKRSGVTDYANFQDFGYMGLYGGMRQKDINYYSPLEEYFARWRRRREVEEFNASTPPRLESGHPSRGESENKLLIIKIKLEEKLKENNQMIKKIKNRIRKKIIN
jgi:DNA-damage-inducible protein D